ncbi:MAG: iron-containing alcohol dehydrogenase [Clostridia bacterium]|nr:iron-containing alcohol dehydrogenase [Clostridia bacterium]
MADLDFSLSQPVRIEFGVGKVDHLEELVKIYGFSKGVLVCDKLFVNNGYAQKLVANTPSLKDIYSDITPNPMLSEVLKAREVLRRVGADFVVALGGGSSMDLAKFASAMYYEDGDIKDYFYKRRDFSTKPLPLIAIPTTAGTGSEVTSVSVCNDDETGTKSPLAHVNFFAHTALVDPNLTLSLPPFVTATTGLDAMAHALEAYWCNAHNPVSDGLAIAALKRIFANIEIAFKDGKNVEARAEMALGSLVAGLAFAPTRTAAVHACSYPLSMYYHLCHGEACAFTLDSYVIINGKADPERMFALAKALGFKDVAEMAAKIKEIKKNLGMKMTLKDAGIDDLTQLVENCASQPLMNNNPAKLNKEELIELFEGLR